MCFKFYVINLIILNFENTFLEITDQKRFQCFAKLKIKKSLKTANQMQHRLLGHV